jgi:glycerol-3-phosphate dehydrogenase (NAD(P)+)
MPELYNKNKQITIIGAGSWGTAIGKVIAENNPGTIVKMWAYEKSTVNSINSRNINSEFLPGVKLPYNIKATTHLKESLINTEGIIIATPSKVMPDTIQKISKLLKDDIPMAYLTKGFCKINNKILTISQTIAKTFPRYGERVVGISGPSHAEEVVKNFHTTLSVAGHHPGDRKFFSDLLNCDFLQCRETDDIIGVDLGGTLKNPAAIAAGMISKFPDCGDNLEGALIAESLKEMIRLGNFMGARTETIIDISGTGDLVATALSDHSRNRRFGKDIAKQIVEKGTILSWSDKIYLRFKPEYVLEKMSKKLHYLAEGAYAIEPLIELADKNSISIPVYRSLYEVLLNKKEPSLLIETIKNPDNFEEIFNNAKIHVKDKKKGLEKLRGKAFKKLILNQLTAKLRTNNSMSGESDDEIISNLKSMLQENKAKNTFLLKNEMKLLSEFIANESDKTLKKIISLYLKETMDHYNPLFYRLFVKLITFKYYWKKIFGNRNSIMITGDFHDLHSLRNSVNTIYAAKFKNLNDYIYYSFGISRYMLPVPRFFVPSEVLKNNFRKFFIRKCGGFIIHRSKLHNKLYLECIMEYLSILAAHGVPFLYFPELQGSGSSILTPNDKFFDMLNSVMFKETTEVVLIPAEITYKNRLNESDRKEPFTEPVAINFSSPVFLSEYTKKTHLEISISELIHQIWILDEIILPHYIICGILSENNFLIKASKLKKIISEYVADNRIIINKSDKTIISEGMKFLLKHSIVVKKDDYYAGLEREQIEKFSDIIKRKKSVRITESD